MRKNAIRYEPGKKEAGSRCPRDEPKLNEAYRASPLVIVPGSRSDPRQFDGEERMEEY